MLDVTDALKPADCFLRYLARSCNLTGKLVNSDVDVQQAAPSEKAVEELLEVADERVSQAEQRAIKAEEAAQAQEGLIEQLCNENLKLGEEIQRLNTRFALPLILQL